MVRQYILSLSIGITSIIVSACCWSVPYIAGMFTTIAIMSLLHGADGLWVMADERKKGKL